MEAESLRPAQPSRPPRDRRLPGRPPGPGGLPPLARGRGGRGGRAPSGRREVNGKRRLLPPTPHCRSRLLQRRRQQRVTSARPCRPPAAGLRAARAAVTLGGDSAEGGAGGRNAGARSERESRLAFAAGRASPAPVSRRAAPSFPLAAAALELRTINSSSPSGTRTHRGKVPRRSRRRRAGKSRRGTAGGRGAWVPGLPAGNVRRD